MDFYKPKRRAIQMKNVLYVGLDVDDKSFHGGGFCEATGETLEFKCKATNAKLLGKLKKLEGQGFQLKTCHEASYMGNSLHRYLISKGIDSTIIAPSMIPELASGRVKTDRVDSNKLAKYFAKGLLTPVYIPDKVDEQARDIIRSRRFFVEQRKSLKNHIVSTLKRYGLKYNEGGENKSYWTISHMAWIRREIKTLDDSGRINLEFLLGQCERMNDCIEEYDKKIEELSELKRYKKKKNALTCFRGISTFSAMALITEIGDIERFSHPSKLVSYAGLDVSEYSSGGKEKKFGITKMGNRWIRTTIVESSQFSGRICQISKRLKEARKGQSKAIVAIADKCMKRLRKKSVRLQNMNKHSNKVKVACAREHLCFVWEALNAAA